MTRSIHRAKRNCRLKRYPRRMVRLYNECAARGQERAELAEQFADNMPRRGRLTWTIRRGEKRLAEIYARLGRDHP